MMCNMLTKAFVAVSTISDGKPCTISKRGPSGLSLSTMHQPTRTPLDRFGIGPPSRSPSALRMVHTKDNKNPRVRNNKSISSSFSSNNNSNNNNNNNESDYENGLLVLMTVPVAWGTFEPAVRLVYKYEPLVPPLVFSFAYYLVATSVLAIGALCSSATTTTTANNLGSAVSSHRAASSLVGGENGDGGSIETDEAGGETTTNPGFFSGLPLSIRGGTELGTYLFVGNALQVIGLKTVPSDRAAFLLQLTTIFVPLLKSITAAIATMRSSSSSLSPQAAKTAFIPLRTWIACLVALLGVALIGLDDGGAGATNNDVTEFAFHLFDRLPTYSVDDGYIVLGAVFYTFHCVRLESYARSTASAIELATAKAATETIWTALAMAGCVFTAAALGGGGASTPGILDTARISGDKIVAYGTSIRQQVSSSSFSSSPLLFFANSEGWQSVGLATAWIGAVTVAYTIYAQSFGQSKIPAVTANLIYSSQPIFTAMVAFLLLGESLGVNGYAGGVLIGAAVVLVIATETKAEEPDPTSKTGS